MATAFGITEEDIVTVLRRMNVQLAPNGMLYDELAEKLFGKVDHHRIEHAALDSGVDLETQTNGALDEIEAILKELGFIEGQLPPDLVSISTLENYYGKPIATIPGHEVKLWNAATKAGAAYAAANPRADNPDERAAAAKCDFLKHTGLSVDKIDPDDAAVWACGWGCAAEHAWETQKPSDDTIHDFDPEPAPSC